MTPSHLLSLAELHAAAPGVLDVVFGPDGDFEGAPRWRPPLWDGAWAHHFGAVPDPIDGLALDLRVPSVAARLAGLCCRAADPARMLDSWRRAADLAARASWGEWNPEYAPALASLFLSLAPRIAPLRKP